MKKTPKIKTQCINCGKTARNEYQHLQSTSFKCDQCGCYFTLDQISMEIRFWSLLVMETQNTCIQIGSSADCNDGDFVGPYSVVIYANRTLNTAPVKLLSYKFLMPAELREKEKLLRCFQ